MAELFEGMKAPQFILPTSTGGNISLRDYIGKYILVLFFYVRDMTSGCIREAKGFRDNADEFENAGAVILGVSTDDMKSHEEFASAHNINFPLLSDVDTKVCDRYGVYVEKGTYGRMFMGIERTTFMVDRKGNIRKIFRNINVDRHADEVLEFVKSLEN